MKPNRWKRIELSKDDSNKLYGSVTDYCLLSYDSSNSCSLFLCNALAIIVPIQLNILFDI